MNLQQRVTEASNLLTSSREEEQKQSLAEFRLFVAELTHTVVGITFLDPHDDEHSYRTTLVERSQSRFFVHLKRDDGHTVTLGKIDYYGKNLWSVMILNVGEQHTFSDGTNQCWFNSPDSSYIPELRTKIEDRLLRFVKGE